MSEIKISIGNASKHSNGPMKPCFTFREHWITDFSMPEVCPPLSCDYTSAVRVVDHPATTHQRPAQWTTLITAPLHPKMYISTAPHHTPTESKLTWPNPLTFPIKRLTQLKVYSIKIWLNNVICCSATRSSIICLQSACPNCLCKLPEGPGVTNTRLQFLTSQQKHGNASSPIMYLCLEYPPLRHRSSFNKLVQN